MISETWQPVEHPVGVDIYDVDRRYFIRALGEFLADRTVPAQTRADEVAGTISAIRQLAAHYGLCINA